MQYDKEANERKKRAIELTLFLYYDTLQIWWIRDYLAWCDEWRSWWAGEGWLQYVQQIQEQVQAEERWIKNVKKRRRKKISKATRRYYEARERQWHYDGWH